MSDSQRTKIAEEYGNRSHKTGATIKLSKEDKGCDARREFVKDDNEQPTSGDVNTKVYVDSNVLSKSQAKQSMLRSLMKRNFNTQMDGLIDACFNINKAKFEKKMGIELGDRVRVWCMYDRNDLNENALCGLVWREVNGRSRSTVKMFEVLFLATFEHVRHQKY